MPEIHLEIPGRGAVEAGAGETAREILARAGVLGDAVAARNTHAAIYDANRLVRTI